jgi:hypothetical protein
MSTRKCRKGGTRKADYGTGESPVVLELPDDDPLIVFSEELKKQLIHQHKENYEKVGWFTKGVLAKPQTGWFSSKSSLVIPTLYKSMHSVVKKLEEKHFQVKKDLQTSDILVEIEYANAATKPIGSNLNIYSDDDDELIGMPTYTCMVCLDMECEGGEIAFYSDPDSKPIESIGGKAKEGFKKVILYSGRLYTKPAPITNGRRIVVIFKIERR